MAYPKERAAMPTSLMVWSSIMLIYGPTAGIVALTIVALSAAVVTLTKRHIETRRERRRQFGRGIKIPAFTPRATRSQAAAAPNGKRKCLVRL